MPLFTKDPFHDPKPILERVFAYIVYRIGEGPDAEDVMSDVVERALRYRASFNPRKGDPAAWMIGIARRSLDRGDLPIPVETIPERPDTTGFEDAIALRLTLDETLKRLEPRDRELLALRYGADLTVPQIARLLDIKANTAQVGIGRALTRLRVLLESSGGGDASAPVTFSPGPGVLEMYTD